MHRPLLVCLMLCLPCLLPGCREPAKSPKQISGPGALALAPVPGNSKIDEEIASIQGQLRQAWQGDPQTWVKLGRTFIRKARLSGDPGFYAQADDAVTRALSLLPADPGGKGDDDAARTGALQMRQLVLLNSHRFVEARALAEQEIKRHPRDEIAWGTLGDSLMEMGSYEGATDAYQRMVDIKPDLRSYNRGAWMRWLLGDGEGAIELMKLALDAGNPKEPESIAYCRVQLGDLHYYRGKYDLARAEYDKALGLLPRYAPALAGRGRLDLATGKLSEAIADLALSLQVQPLTAVRAIYIDALLAAGRAAEASEQTALLEREGRREDPRSLSLFYSQHGQKPKDALELATDELQRRPDVWSLDAMAWALYRLGKLDDAWAAIESATRVGVRDPRLMFHRGRIAAARSDNKDAVISLRAVLDQSPTWDPRDAKEAREVLASVLATPGSLAPSAGAKDDKRAH